ncbi:DUF1700 domain-containing protein [Acetivibrio clariflavus]|nr:DUF1700 domain-containing protein [Acetivibrio clariflavus]
MKKSEYMNILSRRLKKLPKDEQKYIIEDYEEYFNIGIQEGRNEEEICEFLGNPEVVAKQFIADYSLRMAEQKNSIPNILRAFYTVAGLGLMSFIIVFPTLFFLFCILLGLFVFSLTITIKGMILLIVIIISFVNSSIAINGVDRLREIFLSTGLVTTGILLFLINIVIVKFIIGKVVRFLKSVAEKYGMGGNKK